MASPRRHFFVCHLALVGALGLGLSPVAQAQIFTDVTAGSGLVRRGIKDGGQVWADFDGDGFLDVLVNTSGRSHLYFQRPGADPVFEEVTDESAPALDRRRGERSAVAADFNNDGLVDFARTDANLLEVYLNRGPPTFRFGDPMTGDPDFVENDTSDPTGDAYEGLGVLDYDDDGWLDLVMDEDGELRIYQNPADGSADFSMVDQAETGFPVDPGGVGDYLAVTDWDLDGRVDIAHRNNNSRDLWHREADGSWTGSDLGDLRSGDGSGGRGGSTLCDIDNDGDFDLFYSSGTGTGVNRAWLQNEGGVFENSGEPNISGSSTDDIVCGDVDNDGDLDLYYSQDGGDDVLVINELDTGTLGYRRIDGYADEDGEGAAFVDWDRDGDLDLYVNQWGGTVTDPMTMMSMETPADNALFENDTDDDRYLAVSVLAAIDGCPTPTITRSDIGAWARLSTESGDWVSGVREVNGGQGHGSQGSPVLHFGLGSDPAATHVLTIRFMYGDEPVARIRVTPADLSPYQHIAVVSSDADADSIPTAIEVAAAGGNPDPDGDGFEAWNDDDSDGDGLLDRDEVGPDPCGTPVDSDGDGLPDFLDDVFDTNPDGSVPDGAIDTGVDAGMGDGAFEPSLQAHGTGCVACTVSSRDEDSRGALLAVALLLLLAVRWRVRRRR